MWNRPSYKCEGLYHICTHIYEKRDICANVKKPVFVLLSYMWVHMWYRPSHLYEGLFHIYVRLFFIRVGLFHICRSLAIEGKIWFFPKNLLATESTVHNTSRFSYMKRDLHMWKRPAHVKETYTYEIETYMYVKQTFKQMWRSLPHTFIWTHLYEPSCVCCVCCPIFIWR